MLIKEELSKEKVQLYITERVNSYDLGVVHSIDRDLIKHIYNEPMKIVSYIDTYEKNEEKYRQMKPLVWSETPWFCETEFIARACGGFAKQFGYSTDKIDELRLLRRNGVRGVFTFFLESKILHRKVFLIS